MGEDRAMQEQLPTSPGMGEDSAPKAGSLEGMQEQLPTSPGMGEDSAPKAGPLEGMQEQLPTTDKSIREYTGRQITVAAITNDGNNDGMLQLFTQAECSGYRPPRGNTAKDAFFGS